MPEETAVALTNGGGAHAVMMATTEDLEDYTVGFSFAERQIESLDQLHSIEVESFELGVDIRIWLTSDALERFRDRRRRIPKPGRLRPLRHRDPERGEPAAAEILSTRPTSKRTLGPARIDGDTT